MLTRRAAEQPTHAEVAWALLKGMDARGWGSEQPRLELLVPAAADSIRGSPLGAFLQFGSALSGGRAALLLVAAAVCLDWRSAHGACVVCDRIIAPLAGGQPR